MLDYREAAAAVAAALDDPERSLIGDPRQQVYKVSLISSEMREAMQFAKQLALLGLTPNTTISHNEFGQPLVAQVNVYTLKDQEALLEVVQGRLSEPRRQALDDLVAARSPIPEALLERIGNAHTRGIRPQGIADKLNELRIIAGMGGKRWTAQKVKKAVAEYQRRADQHPETA